MNIGFDVDGVLVDMAGYQLRYGEPYFLKRNIPIKNASGFDIKDIFDCTAKEREKFWIKYIWKYCLSEPMTSGASELTRKLKADGHKITIVTARAHTTETGLTGKVFRKMLKHWLKKNQFIYDEIYYCSETESPQEKMDVCLRQKIDVLIDDKPENIRALKDKIHIICYSAPWNADITEFDFFRANEMSEVYSQIQAIN